MTTNVNLNINDTDDTIMNSILKLDLSTKTAQKDDKTTFSNLINNINNKTQQTQTKFIDKAVKSNTSSINKLALKNNSVKTNIQNVKNQSFQTPQKIDDNIQSSNQQYISVQNNTVSSNEKTFEVSLLKDIDLKNNDVINNSINDFEQNPKSDPLNESSPSFSLIKDIDLGKVQKTEENDIQDDLNEIIQNVLITFDIDLNQNEDLKNIIQNEISTIETPQDIIKAIENISSELNNYFLQDDSADTKKEINSFFNNLKTTINNFINQDNDFKQIYNEIINIQKVVNQTSLLNIDNDKNIQKNNDIKIVNNELKDTINQVIDKIDKTISLKKEIIQNNTIANSIDNSTDNDAIQKTDITKIENDDLKIELNENIKYIKENLNKISDIIQRDFNLEENKVSEENNQLIDIIKNIKVSIENNEIDFNSLELNTDKLEKIVSLNETVYSQEFVELNNKLSKKINELDIKNFNNENNKEIVKDILNIFNEYKNNDDFKNLNENNEIKIDEIKIDEIIEKLNSYQNQNISDLNLKENKIEYTKLIQDIKEQINEYATEDKIAFDTDVFEKKLDFKQENKINLSEIQDQIQNTSEMNDDEFDLNQNDFEFNQEKNNFDTNLSSNIKNKEIVQDKTPKLNSETPSIIDEIKEDMLLDIKFENNISGALSVADEVAKMAMNEENSLNSQTPVGTVTYDSASLKNAALIKAPSQLIKISENETQFSDVLNQIGNKLTQLKDGNQKLTMILRPNDLGRLSIELTSDKNGLTTHIMAQNEDVRNYIEKNIQSLRQQLTQAGINVNSIQIKTFGSENSTNYDGNNNFLAQDEKQQSDNQSQNQQNNNQQNQKRNEETLASLSNYDIQFNKDFSSVLNKTLNYSLT